MTTLTREYEKYSILSLLFDPAFTSYITQFDLSSKEGTMEAIKTVINLDQLRQGAIEEARHQRAPQLVMGGFGNTTII